jgi:hypothetical protein
MECQRYIRSKGKPATASSSEFLVEILSFGLPGLEAAIPQEDGNLTSLAFAKVTIIVEVFGMKRWHLRFNCFINLSILAFVLCLTQLYPLRGWTIKVVLALTERVKSAQNATAHVNFYAERPMLETPLKRGYVINTHCIREGLSLKKW